MEGWKSKEDGLKGKKKTKRRRKEGKEEVSKRGKGYNKERMRIRFVGFYIVRYIRVGLELELVLICFIFESAGGGCEK